MPQGRAPLEGEQVHGHRPALALLAEGAVDGHGHVVEEDLGELRGAVHGLDGPHLDAGAVHVHEQGGDAPVGRLGGAGPGEEDTAVGVLGQAGPHLLAGDPPDVAVRVARQDRAARLLPVPGSEKPWHQVSSPRSSRGTMPAASAGAA